MDNNKLFAQEDDRLKHYEISSQRQMEQEDGTELGYRYVNTRFLNMEKDATEATQWAKKAEAHMARKNNLEAAWHANTTEKVADLEKKATSRNKKDKAYYQAFSLKELEIFLKNSDRGGNSETYNNVVTDLELYNRLSEQVNPNESYTLLTRLADSCRIYMREHNKIFMWTSKGKIRKAMISQLTDKVNVLLNERRTELVTGTENSYANFSKDKSAENVNSAVKAHFNRICQHLQGNLTMNEDEVKQVDVHMAEVYEKLKDQKVDENQSDTVPTKFFNAIGWAANKPLLTDMIMDETERSPLKRNAYHAIQPLSENTDATGPARQLAGTAKGDCRQFYSDGMYGRGTYLAVRSDKEGASDDQTIKHDWSYGDKKGGVMVTMCLNENSRIIGYFDLEKLINGTFSKQFPKLYEKIKTVHTGEKRKRTGSEFLTILAAFFGYNTIKGHSGSADGLTDYYVTTDRRAMTIFTIAQENQIEKSTDSYDKYDFYLNENRRN